jgi:nicotinate (nicotinamide) nucleotide adenylyltransferase
MLFLRRAQGRPSRVGILPGAFNPPTVAHLALAQSALARVEEILLVLPKALPHKTFEGASFEARIEMLRVATADWPSLSVAVSEGGLFRDIASECRQAYGEDTRLSFLCGRDAAERILNWDYGAETIVTEMLCEFDLLVAARRGELAAPLHARHAIERLNLSDDLDLVSSSEVRDRIARGEPWEHLVPEAVRKLAADIYRPKSP